MENIQERLAQYIETKKIPNLLFHGSRMNVIIDVINEFINNIYKNDAEKISSYVLTVNCGYNKGIRFIREDLMFFAKTYINNTNGTFKSVVMINADKLTFDAQSALRRCIELFSHSTRFFIGVETKYNILKPILSRFCEIYVTQNITTMHPVIHKFTTRQKYIKNSLTKLIVSGPGQACPNMYDIIKVGEKLYNKAYSSNDLIQLLNIEGVYNIPSKRRYELMLFINKIKKEFRNEEMLICFILYIISDTANTINLYAIIT